MSNKLKGTSLAGGAINRIRVENDFYATDMQSVRDLLNVADIKGKSFYEPCCGQGHISKVLLEYFPEANHYATDLIDRGYGEGGVDFILDSIDTKADWIITNPPYSLAQEFITKSLFLTSKGVAMFLKIQFLEGQARRDWFKNTPLKYVYVFSKRQDPLRDGMELNPETGKKWGSTMCFAWYIWEQGYVGEPIIRWI
jgi:hypothetical protein